MGHKEEKKHIKNLFLLISNWSLWREWRRCRKGKLDTFLFKKTCGYFYTTKDIIHRVPMQSGMIARAICIDHENYSDPYDMVKEATFSIVGYDGYKDFKDMTFYEICNFWLDKGLKKRKNAK